MLESKSLICVVGTTEMAQRTTGFIGGPHIVFKLDAEDGVEQSGVNAFSLYCELLRIESIKNVVLLYSEEDYEDSIESSQVMCDSFIECFKEENTNGKLSVCSAKECIFIKIEDGKVLETETESLPEKLVELITKIFTNTDEVVKTA